jgi:hypothetical protein
MDFITSRCRAYIDWCRTPILPAEKVRQHCILGYAGKEWRWLTATGLLPPPTAAPTGSFPSSTRLALTAVWRQ